MGEKSWHRYTQKVNATWKTHLKLSSGFHSTYAMYMYTHTSTHAHTHTHTTHVCTHARVRTEREILVSMILIFSRTIKKRVCFKVDVTTKHYRLLLCLRRHRRYSGPVREQISWSPLSCEGGSVCQAQGEQESHLSSHWSLRYSWNEQRMRVVWLMLSWKQETHGHSIESFRVLWDTADHTQTVAMKHKMTWKENPVFKS